MSEMDHIHEERTTAVSVFGQADGSTNDFPVLKAFQEYIDAEQAKARKRMLGLSAFFVVLLLMVVVTFVFVLTAVINRNQALSDKILDIVLKERAAAAPAASLVTVQQQPAPLPASARPAAETDDRPAMKPVLEKLEALTQALSKTKTETSVATPVETPREVKTAETARLQEALNAQQARLKEVEEQLRKAEIEKQRRRLYPKYYEQEEVNRAAAERERERRALEKLEAPLPPAVPSAPAAKSPLSEIKPIQYFRKSTNEEEELRELMQINRAKASTAAPKKAPAVSAPSPTVKTPAVRTKPPAGTKTLKIESDKNGSIPWLIEETH